MNKQVQIFKNDKLNHSLRTILNDDGYKEVLPIIDESIRTIKLDRPQQVGMWD